MIATLEEKIILDEKNILYRLKCPDMKERIKPGQFFEFRIDDGIEPFLRRPISIFDADGRYLSFLVRLVGKGTKRMSEWKTGKKVDLLGPLGNGFQVSEKEKTVLLVGAGSGAAPLHFLAKQLHRQGKTVKFLFLPKRDAAIRKALEDVQNKMPVIYAENRAELPVILNKELTGIDAVYVCGPMPMMRTVAEFAGKSNIPVQVSLETKMGCGMGICMGCVVPIRSEGNGFEYKRVCYEGPVFSGEEVIFE